MTKFFVMYIFLNMKIKLDAKRLAEFRKGSNLTQDDLGTAIGQSGRTVRRMESVDNEIKLSCADFYQLSQSLNVWSWELWGELPPLQKIYGVKINDAEHFARVIIHPYTNKIFFKHIPNDETIEQTMLELEKIVYNKLPSNLTNIIRYRNIFRSLKSKLSFAFYPYGLAITSFSDDQMKLNSASWESKITICGYNPINDAPIIHENTTDVGENQIHPDTGERVWWNQTDGVPLEEFNEIILNSRPVYTGKNYMSSDEQEKDIPFAEANVDDDLDINENQ